MPIEFTTVATLLEDPENNATECFNFYDWFCKDSALERHMKSFIPKLKWLVKEGIINDTATEVWFKNNCPFVGALYNDMRFNRVVDGGDNVYRGGVVPRTGFNNKEDKCELFFWDENDNFVEMTFPTWSVFKKEVKANPELKQTLTTAWK